MIHILIASFEAYHERLKEYSLTETVAAAAFHGFFIPTPNREIDKIEHCLCFDDLALRL